VENVNKAVTAGNYWTKITHPHQQTANLNHNARETFMNIGVMARGVRLTASLTIEENAMCILNFSSRRCTYEHCLTDPPENFRCLTINFKST
jgi:hypothetical protein